MAADAPCAALARPGSSNPRSYAAPRCAARARQIGAQHLAERGIDGARGWKRLGDIRFQHHDIRARGIPFGVLATEAAGEVVLSAHGIELPHPARRLLHSYAARGGWQGER